jgi:hypothetical protein
LNPCRQRSLGFKRLGSSYLFQLGFLFYLAAMIGGKLGVQTVIDYGTVVIELPM